MEAILLKGLKWFYLFVKFEFYCEKRNNLLRISEKKRESGVNYGKRVASFAKNKGGI